MKENILKISILSLFLISICLITILVYGNTYQMEFDNVENCELEIEDENKTIKVINKEFKDNKCIIQVEGKKAGKASIFINYGTFKTGRSLYIHNNLVITDNNYFGRSTASEVIPISITILLLYILYLLIKKYNYNKKENLFQYKNISYLGIIIFITFFAIYNILSIFNYRGLFDTIEKVISSISFVSIILFPIATVTFILVTISNIKLIIKEGKTLKNLLGLFLGIFLCISTLLPDFVYKLIMQSQTIDIYNLNGPGPYIYNFLETLVYLTISYLECILIGTIIIAIKSVRKKHDYNKDYIIILGCKLQKDGSLTKLLKGRVDKAIEFRNEQLNKTGKDLVFIPSGGKGKDEVIEESIAMKKYLMENGINEKNILPEKKSTNTYENIKYSNKLIKKKNQNICISTTNYHVLRAGLIATEQGLKFDGIGSKTKAYFWINAFIREFIGTLYEERKKHILVFAIITILIIGMISITYFANNI